MGRLERRDERALRALVEEASTVRPQQPDLWTSFLPAFAETLRAPTPLAYDVRLTDRGLRIGFMEGWRSKPMLKLVRAAADAGFAARPTRFTAYDPLRLEPDQQNRVKRLHELRSGAVTTHWKSWGVGDHDQLRVLICERGVLLAWVGAYRPLEEPFTDRESVILRRLIPSLRARLAFEQRIEAARWAGQAIDVCLDALSQSALITNPLGHVLHANALARQQLSRDRQGLRSRLQAMHRGHEVGLHALRLSAPGLSGHALVIDVQDRLTGSRSAVAFAARRWDLSAREADVLTRVADGASNREVAAMLDCAERTVEGHVSKILLKSGASSRAHLVSRLAGEGRR